MAKEELKVGDVVELKSGSFEMVVVIIYEGYAYCYWKGNDLEIKRAKIPIEGLMKAKKSNVKVKKK